MKKNIVRIIAMVFGIFLFFNGVFLLIFAGFNAGSFLTALLGLCLIILTVFKNITRKIMGLHISRFILAIVSLVLVSVIAISAILFIYGNMRTVTYREGYLLVLGCGVDGERPSAALVSRLDTALEYCEKNTECKIIVSGGRGKGEDITEAEAMRRYLTEKGIDNDRIIKEEKSTSTTENFMFSNRLVDDGFASDSVAVITNDFHVYRANSLARYQGFNINHMGAPTVWYNIVPSYLREMLAIVKMFLFNK